MPSTHKYTPWRHDSELAMVRDWFFPRHTAATSDPYNISATSPHITRKKAVDRVNIWTFKTNRVPHAILATADLTDALLHYESMDLCHPERNVISYRAAQFVFSFAFMRFVNGFVDRDVAKKSTSLPFTLSRIGDDVEEDANDDQGDEQRRLSTAKAAAAGENSMYAHAVAIGMPSRFVDLRHQATHGELPDLKALKTAAEQALEWMWLKWWKSMARGDPGRALRELAEISKLDEIAHESFKKQQIERELELEKGRRDDQESETT